MERGGGGSRELMQRSILNIEARKAGAGKRDGSNICRRRVIGPVPFSVVSRFLSSIIPFLNRIIRAVGEIGLWKGE
jgi:hypothetical protein